MELIYNRSAEYIATLEKKHNITLSRQTCNMDEKYFVFVHNKWYWDYYQVFIDRVKIARPIISVPIPPHTLEIDENCPYIQCLAYYFPEDAKELGITTANRNVPVDMESADIMNMRPLSSENRISAHLDYYQLTGKRLFPHKEETIPEHYNLHKEESISERYNPVPHTVELEL